MIKTYSYTISGIGAGGAPWQTEGTVEQDNFRDAMLSALKDSFLLLTEGHATYGGGGRCGGPYTVQRMVIEVVNQTRGRLAS